MVCRLATFWGDEGGKITLDWIVLSVALVGTGFSVMSTLSAGIETAGLPAASNLRGHVVRSSFESDFCRGGLSALQMREDARIASGGGDEIFVTSWMSTRHRGLSDASLRAEYERLSDATRDEDSWTRDRTILTALECEMVLRGLD